MHKTLFVLVAAVAVMGAAPPQFERVRSSERQLAQASIPCKTPRPEICPQVYQPVCALRSDGTRDTFSNGCMACIDTNVVSYVRGPCR
jgi:hypothetical protein